MAEALAATLVLGAAGMLCLTMAATGTSARRQQLDRQTALFEAENILQRLAALELRNVALQGEDGHLPEDLYRQLDGRLQARLPGARLEVRVQHVTTPLAGRQISVAVRLPARKDALAPLVRLTTWVYPPQEGSP
jgi:hypothetical protein